MSPARIAKSDPAMPRVEPPLSVYLVQVIFVSAFLIENSGYDERIESVLSVLVSSGHRSTEMR